MMRWRHARLPALAALALWAAPDTVPRPEGELRAKMLAPVVREVQPVADNPPDITLTCAMERTERTIRIHYFLSNESRATIVTFDRVRFNALNTLTLPVDVVCDAGDGAVNLVLGMSPDPVFGTMRTTQPHGWSQEVIRLGPSKNVAATVELSLPLVEWDQWNAGTSWVEVANVDQEVEVHTARLVVDFVRLDRSFGRSDAPADHAESVWCAIPLAPPVTLLRHPGFGELGDPARMRAFNLGPDKVRDPAAALAGHRELRKAIDEHRARHTRPRRRGTSPVDMPKTWQHRWWSVERGG